jgi:hypothetical protein
LSIEGLKIDDRWIADCGLLIGWRLLIGSAIIGGLTIVDGLAIIARRLVLRSNRPSDLGNSYSTIPIPQSSDPQSSIHQSTISDPQSSILIPQ